ncbi:MepB family protein [Cryobacterium sinapicolor]|uniref:MepB family protein n=1 Tax=Cryobacterium sinapicolor TaxID=1259236 RepID=UPI001F54616F|nr:MepB family protein [Cryobacterium sinapicolor]
MAFSAFHRYLDLLQLPQSVSQTITPEAQSSDYESGIVLLESGLWRLRTARITPTKPGAFVALWRRLDDGATAPFGVDDRAVGLHVFVEELDHFGVFQFTAAQLASLGISQTRQAPGKRGFRVYPSWCKGLNRQAARSQKAQSLAFHDLTAR